VKAVRIEPTLRLVRSANDVDVRQTWAAAQAAGKEPKRVPVELPGAANDACSLCAGGTCCVPEACQVQPTRHYLAWDVITVVLASLALSALVVVLGFLVFSLQ
jgi:hypothetical protein